MECVQWLCISISKLLLLSLHYLYSTALWLSVIHIGFIKSKLCRGWKWYVGSRGRETIARLNYRYSVYSFAGTCLEEGER